MQWGTPIESSSSFRRRSFAREALSERNAGTRFTSTGAVMASMCGSSEQDYPIRVPQAHILCVDTTGYTAGPRRLSIDLVCGVESEPPVVIKRSGCQNASQPSGGGSQSFMVYTARVGQWEDHVRKASVASTSILVGNCGAQRRDHSRPSCRKQSRRVRYAAARMPAMHAESRKPTFKHYICYTAPGTAWFELPEFFAEPPAAKRFFWLLMDAMFAHGQD